MGDLRWKELALALLLLSALSGCGGTRPGTTPDGASLIARMERQHGIHALEHGEEIGLGSRTYELVRVDG